MLLTTVLLLSILSLNSASRPGFLRSSIASNDEDASDKNDHLMNCMFKGGNPAACHELDCFWCRNKMFSLCVTAARALDMNGSVFTCEAPPPGPDDDAAPKPPPCPCNDDCTGDDKTPATDDAPPAPTDDAPPDPTDDAPPAPSDDDWNVVDDTPPPEEDDTPPPATDDGGGGEPAEKKYMDDLLACMEHSQDGCGLNGTACVWCGNTLRIPMGICFSDEAAKNMEGAVYKCNWVNTTTAIGNAPVVKDHSSFLPRCNTMDRKGCNNMMNVQGSPCQWCDWDTWGGICLDDSQFDMMNEVAPCGMTNSLLEYVW